MEPDDVTRSELDTLAFYEQRLARKLLPMSQQERAVFLIDLFGSRHSRQIYERICMQHPELTGHNGRRL